MTTNPGVSTHSTGVLPIAVVRLIAREKMARAKATEALAVEQVERRAASDHAERLTTQLQELKDMFAEATADRAAESAAMDLCTSRSGRDPLAR